MIVSHLVYIRVNVYAKEVKKEVRSPVIVFLIFILILIAGNLTFKEKWNTIKSCQNSKYPCRII